MKSTHYGLKVGDRVKISKFNNNIYKVTHLYKLDNNKVLLMDRNGYSFDYTAEWCIKIKLDK